MADRGLAFAIVFEFLLALAFFAIIWLFLNEPAQMFWNMSASSAPAGSEWARGSSYAKAMWDYAPVWAAAAATLFLQARAAFESRGGVS